MRCNALVMTASEIDAYLQQVDEPGRTTLETVRRAILDVIPEAEQCISYSVPAFKVDGKVVAGLAAFTHHLSYLPHSGSVLGQLGEELAGYTKTKSALHFPHDTPLPPELVRRLIEVRRRQLT